MGVEISSAESMTSDLDIYRAANLLIKQHGDEAAIHAAMRVDELLEASDLDGYTVWKRVLKAVEELLDKGPPGKHDRVH